jgi:hypothetical protein
MKWSACIDVGGVDLSPAFDQESRDVPAWKECVLTLLEQVLTLERVVLHHGEVEEGISGGGTRINSMNDVVNATPKTQVVVAAL